MRVWFVSSRRRNVISFCVVALALITAAAGCNWLKPLAFVLPEPKEVIPAEFAHLSGTATVLVWVPLDTRYEYRHARLELASFVGQALGEGLPEVQFTDAEAVEDYQRGASQWSVDPEVVGREFRSQYVIYLEILEFALREPEAPDLLRGRVAASVAVYDLSAADAPPKRFDLKSVQTVVPEDGPMIFSRNGELALRQMTYQEFAGQVAKKFFDHEEVVQ